MTKRRAIFNTGIDQGQAHRMCLAKPRYKNKNQARDAAAHHKDKLLHPYRCLYCSSWHLTSKPIEEAGAIRQAIRRRETRP